MFLLCTATVVVSVCLNQFSCGFFLCFFSLFLFSRGFEIRNRARLRGTGSLGDKYNVSTAGDVKSYFFLFFEI